MISKQKILALKGKFRIDLPEMVRPVKKEIKLDKTMSITTIDTDFFDIDICSMIGKRETMEDRFSAFRNGEKFLIGVFDGHRGSSCSEFISKNIHKYVEETDGFSLIKAFERTNDEFRAKRGGSGSTCCLAIIENSILKVCNVGDSRLMVIRNGRIILSTIDQTPENPGEYDRLLKAGCFVTNNRLNGFLAVSRAFGDFDVKGISCTPDFYEIKLETGDLIFMSSDGVCSKYFEYEKILEIINKHDGDNYIVLNAKIANEGLLNNGGDNCMSVLIRFDEQKRAKTDIMDHLIPRFPSYGCRLMNEIKLNPIICLFNRLRILERKYLGIESELEAMAFSEMPPDLVDKYVTEEIRAIRKRIPDNYPYVVDVD